MNIFRTHFFYLMLFVLILSSTAMSVCNAEELYKTDSTDTALPYRDLSARRIMAIEGITSIHYIGYHIPSVSSDSSYPIFEYYIDTSRIKTVQYLYFSGNLDSNVNVIDIGKNRSWRFYVGKLTDLEYRDQKSSYELYIKGFLGVSIDSTFQVIGTEIIDTMTCDVYARTDVAVCWIWRTHRIEVQARCQDNLEAYPAWFQRKRIIEINTQFPDSLFSPPN